MRSDSSSAETSASAACGLCARPATPDALREAAFADAAVIERIARDHPGWRTQDGACPACVQDALLQTLREHGEAEFRHGVQRAWPLDARSAFGALPAPLRLRADPRFTGRRIGIALVDAAFVPHPDLAEPRNRIRAVADATGPRVEARHFGPGAHPRWPRSETPRAAQWHGLMTSCAAAGSGRLSHGLYRGLAPEAELVLVETMDDSGRIGDAAILRALLWLLDRHRDLGVRVVNLSLGGDGDPALGASIDEAIDRLAAERVVVVAAAGNAGERRLVPPATSASAITVGGLDDHNVLDEGARTLWHGNHGDARDGRPKPELVAPSLWVVAPLLPGTPEERSAARLFEARARGDDGAGAALERARLVTPHYQHVEGTSFAAPLVAGAVACMLEANPSLSPARVRALLQETAHPVPGASRERQGAGALDAGRAVAEALAERVVVQRRM